MANNSRKLGRGLDALFADSSASTEEVLEEVSSVSDDDVVNQIPVKSISPNPFQPRKTFNQEALEELSHSIQKNGIIQPIIVRKVSDNKFEIVAGERRFRASKLANLKEVPVVIREFDDESMLQLAIIENLQRENLNAIEEAQGIKRLIDTLGLKQDEAAARLGKSRAAIANLLRLLNLLIP